MGKTQVISKEIKEQILHRVKDEGISVPQAARDAGISNTTIYGWLGRTAQKGTSEVELLRVKRELAGAYEMLGKLTSELNLLKKKNGYSH